MKKKKKKRLGAPQIAFQILNSIVIIAILSVYGYRFVKYYKYYKELSNPTQSQALTEVLINTVDITAKKGLMINEDGSYTYYGEAENNYIYYSGSYYRILSINKDGNISVLSTILICNRAFNVEGDFIDNPIEEVLFNQYHSKLYKAGVNLTYCVNYVEKIDDVTSISKDVIEQDIFIRPLTLQEYQAAGGKQSFINSNEAFWLENYDANNAHYYVDEEGNVSISNSINQTLPLKVVICVSGRVKYVRGDGTLDNPYMFSSETSPTTLDKCFINQYVSLGSNTYVVTNINEDGNVLLTLAGVIKDGENEVKKAYGLRNDYINSDVYKYLNEEFVKTIDDYENKLVKTKYKYTVLNSVSEIVYDNCTHVYDECYVGLVDITNLFVNGKDILTSTLINGNNRSVVVMKDHVYYEDLSKTSYNLQVVISALGSLEIGSGSGTLNDPFVVK